MHFGRIQSNDWMKVITYKTIEEVSTLCGGSECTTCFFAKLKWYFSFLLLKCNQLENLTFLRLNPKTLKSISQHLYMTLRECGCTWEACKLKCDGISFLRYQTVIWPLQPWFRVTQLFNKMLNMQTDTWRCLCSDSSAVFFGFGFPWHFLQWGVTYFMWYFLFCMQFFKKKTVLMLKWFLLRKSSDLCVGGWFFLNSAKHGFCSCLLTWKCINTTRGGGGRGPASLSYTTWTVTKSDVDKTCLSNVPVVLTLSLCPYCFHDGLCPMQQPWYRSEVVGKEQPANSFAGTEWQQSIMCVLKWPQC